MCLRWQYSQELSSPGVGVKLQTGEGVADEIYARDELARDQRVHRPG